MRNTIAITVYFFTISFSIASTSFYQEALQSFESDEFELSIKNWSLIGVTELIDEIDIGKTGLLPGTTAKLTDPFGNAAGAE